LGLEVIEAVLSAAAFPASEGGDADGVAGRAGDVVVAGGDLSPRLPLAPAWVRATQQGQDERVAKEGDLGATVFRIKSVGHGLLGQEPEAAGSFQAMAFDEVGDAIEMLGRCCVWQFGQGDKGHELTEQKVQQGFTRSVGEGGDPLPDGRAGRVVIEQPSRQATQARAERRDGGGHQAVAS